MDLLKLTEPEFERIAKLIYERTGIHLPDSKLTLLSNRLRRRLRSLKMESYQAYYDLLCDRSRCEEELPHFLSAVTTNETYFFRNEALWRHIRGTWIPEIMARKKDRPSKTIRVWSAASSSGEEAYTMAICLLEGISHPAAWQMRVIGSDISQRVLDRAGEGIYNDYAVSKVPPETLKRWFESADGKFTLKAEARKVVTFQFHNLRDPFPNGNFDLVFLRNVLMYFDNPMKVRVLNNVTRALAPEGYLIVGDVDPIRNTPELRDAMTLEYGGPNLYRKPAEKLSAAVAQGRS